jgi:subtilase family serine protease
MLPKALHSRAARVLAAIALTAGLALAALPATPAAAGGRVSPAVGVHPHYRAAGKPRAAGDQVLFGCQQPTAEVPCYGPSQIQNAYRFTPLYKAGITGRGRTIAIVDAFQSPTIRDDLALFDQTFGLPDPKFTIVAPDGLTPFDENDPNQVGWAVEISLDVQWAHAIAPDAAITLVLAKSNEDADILSATRYVVDHGLADVISQSFGEAEECMDPALLRAQHELFQRATAKRITLVASSGDDGYSKVFATPRFQRPLHLPSRGVPDVAYNGDVFGGVLVAFGVNIGPGTGPGSFFIVGGTSAGAPQWSALTALTDQVAHRRVGFLNSAIYDIARSLLYAATFHDITTGDNSIDGITGFEATRGWDAVTGWGTPKAATLVPLLALKAA